MPARFFKRVWLRVPNTSTASSSACVVVGSPLARSRLRDARSFCFFFPLPPALPPSRPPVRPLPDAPSPERADPEPPPPPPWVFFTLKRDISA